MFTGCYNFLRLKVDQTTDFPEPLESGSRGTLLGYKILIQLHHHTQVTLMQAYLLVECVNFSFTLSSSSFLLFIPLSCQLCQLLFLLFLCRFQFSLKFYNNNVYLIWHSHEYPQLSTKNAKAYRLATYSGFWVCNWQQK